jgi:dTDP-4-amino-4,6-dideoxygalactose transaminase
MTYKIPFNRAFLTGNEPRYMSEAVQNGHISGDGPFTKRCHALLEEELGVRKAFLTTSCTHALEMCALLLDLQPGDEFILPSFTFVSTANAFVLRGAVPKFADIRADTLNIDETRIESLLTSKTKAIVVVHYAGVACEMDAIIEIAERYGIPIVEDNAHGLFGKYKGRPLGSFGCMATQSFHETKNFTCGEGGAILVNDASLIERAEIIREKGTNRSRFFRGEIDKYTWVDVGSSYLPSEILAAFLYAQLENRALIQFKRENIWSYYNSHLQSWATDYGARLPIIPETCEQPFHMFYVLMPNRERQQGLIEHLKRSRISSVFHYLPLHISEMGRKYGGKLGDCPVTERLSDCLVRLPFYSELTESQQDEILEAMHRLPTA